MIVEFEVVRKITDVAYSPSTSSEISSLVINLKSSMTSLRYELVVQRFFSSLLVTNIFFDFEKKTLIDNKNCSN